MANADGLRQKLIDQARTAVAHATELMVNDLRDAAPVAAENDGTTRDSIYAEPTVDSTTTFGYRIVSPTPQGEFVEDGTDPHIIVPVNANVLHWVGDGGHVFAKQVNHPGMPPRPWFHPITDKWSDYLADEFG